MSENQKNKFKKFENYINSLGFTIKKFIYTGNLLKRERFDIAHGYEDELTKITINDIYKFANMYMPPNTLTDIIKYINITENFIHTNKLLINIDNISNVIESN